MYIAFANAIFYKYLSKWANSKCFIPYEFEYIDVSIRPLAGERQQVDEGEYTLLGLRDEKKSPLNHAQK